MCRPTEWLFCLPSRIVCQDRQSSMISNLQNHTERLNSLPEQKIMYMICMFSYTYDTGNQLNFGFAFDMKRNFRAASITMAASSKSLQDINTHYRQQPELKHSSSLQSESSSKNVIILYGIIVNGYQIAWGF
jgi:hypothetical protein